MEKELVLRLIRYLNSVSLRGNTYEYFEAFKEISDTCRGLVGSNDDIISTVRDYKKALIKFIKNMPRDANFLNKEDFVYYFGIIFDIMTGYIQNKNNMNQIDFDIFREYIDSMKGLNLEPFYCIFARRIAKVFDEKIVDFVLSTFYTVEIDNVVKQNNEGNGLSSMCNYGKGEYKEYRDAIDKILKKHHLRPLIDPIGPSPIEVDCEIMLKAAIMNKSIPGAAHDHLMAIMTARDSTFAELVNYVDMKPDVRTAWFQFLVKYNFPLT